MKHQIKFKQTEIGKIPEDWDVAKLDDICEKITDGSHFSPKTEFNGKPIATVKDMTDYGFNISTCRLISEKDFDNLSKQDCKPLKDDVLIAKDGSYLKHVFVFDGKEEVVILSSIAILRPDKNKINPSFLKYLFTDSKTKERVSGNYVSGAVIPRIILRDFEKIELPVPPLPEQHAIAKILSDLDSKIELNNKMNKTLEAIGQALFKKWFVDNLDKASWDVKTLADVSKEITRGFTTKYIEKSNLINLNQKVNRGNFLDKTNFKYYPNETEVPLNKFARKKDILINSLGQGTLGRIHYYLEETENVVVDQHITILRINQEISYPEYVYYSLIDKESKNRLESAVSGSTGMLMLNISKIREFEISIPPRHLQEKFKQIIESLNNHKLKNFLEYERLSQIRDALLPKLMSGEVRVK